MRITAATVFALFLVVGVTTSCGDGNDPAGRPVTPSGRAMREYPDGFDFLPPLHATKGLTSFNSEARPVVEIYAGSDAAKGALLRRFETAEIAVETDHFHVNWDTSAAEGGLPDGFTECVVEVHWETAGGSDQMGFVDCLVDKAAGKGKKATDPDDYFFTLQDGRTLPIKFAIDQTVEEPVDLAVTAVEPGSGIQGETLSLTVTGTGFKPGSTVTLSGTGIAIESTTVVSETVITVAVSIDAEAPVGPRDVSVSTPRGYVATLSGAFTIEARVVLVERILYSSNRTGDHEIWSMSPDGTDQRQLTQRPGIDDYPSASPDGRRIYFHGFAAGHPDILAMDTDGTNTTLLVGGTSDEYFPMPSPDGRYLAFSSTRDGTMRIWVYDLNTGAMAAVSPHPGYGPVWSPDSSRIYYEAYPSGNAEVWSIAPDGSGLQRHTSLSEGVFRSPAISPDGLKMAAFSGFGSGPFLYLAPAGRTPGTGGIQQITSSIVAARPSFSPAGDWIATRGNNSSQPSHILKVLATSPFTKVDLIPPGLSESNNAPWWTKLVQ